MTPPKNTAPQKPKEPKNKRLNPKQEKFCELYATDRDMFGNGTQAYIEAYDIDASKPGSYAGARANAYKQLTKAHILARIREHMDTAILNDNFVDRELAFVIEQCADMPSKMRAIEQYNKLKARIIEKHEHKTEGIVVNIS